MIQLGLDWQATDRLAVNGALHWIPTRTPVDNMNTVYNRSYALVHIGADYAITDQAAVVLRVANLFDKHYAASTLVVDQASAQQAAFIPGAGRALYVGARLRF